MEGVLGGILIVVGVVLGVNQWLAIVLAALAVLGVADGLFGLRKGGGR